MDCERTVVHTHTYTKWTVKELLFTHIHTQNGLFLGQKDLDCFVRPIKTLSEHFRRSFWNVFAL